MEAAHNIPRVLIGLYSEHVFGINNLDDVDRPVDCGPRSDTRHIACIDGKSTLSALPSVLAVWLRSYLFMYIHSSSSLFASSYT